MEFVAKGGVRHVKNSGAQFKPLPGIEPYDGAQNYGRQPGVEVLPDRCAYSTPSISLSGNGWLMISARGNTVLSNHVPGVMLVVTRCGVHLLSACNEILVCVGEVTIAAIVRR
jgi:hypothetical protein